MRKRLPISVARSNLSGLLKQLQRHPQQIIEISVNGLILGELRAPENNNAFILPGSALKKAAEAMGKPDGSASRNRSVARRHNDYLYKRS